MRFIADLHLHSPYSRATSKTINLEELARWGKIKGIDIIGTSDFTHPAWRKEITSNLTEREPGLYCLKNSRAKTRFILSSEISCIYKKNNKVRKIHLLLLVPTIKAADKITAGLAKIGNVKSDGRPILGVDARDIVKLVLDADSNSLVIPAHIWTPWFSLFGSRSGFDSLEECFDKESKYIYALETGLSSDPEMNWKISDLDKYTLVSNSDAHSPDKLGREANVFELPATELSFNKIRGVIKSGDPRYFPYTIEFFPEEGKYHYDGHRACHVSLTPQQSTRQKNICPVCGKPLTIGVLHRAAELADRNKPKQPKNKPSSRHLVPLHEIIIESLGKKGPGKQTRALYLSLIKKFGPEFNILLDLDPQILATAGYPAIATAITNLRTNQVKKLPGFDGEFGKIYTLQKND